ncbi:MAG: hypothetical protein HC929_07810 [Leptolyngbyaceae cyanobacterium SM2_5_2]|nr:hypothetical protein [Leptolyngbyaceae cyanobacterium SM2_5_2]
MLISLVAAFRQQYPGGSLISDLLVIQDGLYVVRAVAMVDGHTLSTGLAAQATLEVAEDNACERALSRLSLPGVASTPADKLVEKAAPLPAGGEGVPTVETGAENSPIPPQAALPSLTAPIDAGVSLRPDLVQPLPEPLSLATSPMGAASSELNFDLEPSLLDAEDIAVSPIDLSDIIAQTDVELQRLGWGVTQGREFLEKTYGKRSRHDLTDEELLEFLLYLETQPSPVA